ncbi:MAG: fumarylacetoacetate hydrolase [Deltaproteobacteria bacterium]|nr:MAG: fumarylacetoacetate hydrolase [Deltaproteobacteria bacterium]
MKISQYYAADGSTKVALVREGKLYPLLFEGDMIDLIKRGLDIVHDNQGYLPSEVSFAPAVSKPSKIIALGLNYKDHADESKGAVPENPLVFAKFPNSLIGHMGTITWSPRITRKVDYEAELAVVIGRETKNCPPDKALDSVFGYTCANDVSARDLQFGDGQWVRGKSLDTFCPLGPWIVTADELPDPNNLKISCRLNGQTMQESNTSNMIFGVTDIISFLSRHFTLYPGDVILTGTPSGVGAFRKPSIYLRDGDEVNIEIQGIGTLSNFCEETG